MKGTKQVTYKQAMTSQEAWKYIKSVGAPIVVLLVTMYVLSVLKISYVPIAVAAMWGGGVLTSILISAQRMEILRHTLVAVLSYMGTLFLMHEAIYIFSNATPEQLMASYNTPVTISQTNILPGLMQTSLQITSGLVPVGFLFMMGKRFVSFRNKRNKDTEYKSLKDYRQ